MTDEVRSSKDQAEIAELVKNLNDRLHFRVHFNGETEIIHLPTYMWDTGRLFMQEAGRIILDKVTVNLGGPQPAYNYCTIFMTVDMDGAWNRWALFNRGGSVLATGYLEEEIGS